MSRRTHVTWSKGLEPMEVVAVPIVLQLAIYCTPVKQDELQIPATTGDGFANVLPSRP